MPHRLEGSWSGAYYQHDIRTPIRAQFSHDGDTLAGAMIDTRADREMSPSEYALLAGLAPGEDERLVLKIRELLEVDSSLPIVFFQRQPVESHIEGHIEGDVVRFRKTYIGPAVSGFRAGDREVSHVNEAHSVDYTGRLSPDGRTLTGHWLIPANPVAGASAAHGDFELTREEA